MSLAIVMSQQQQNQTSRWCFTLNNYDRNKNYKDHFLQFNHIKRSVWGYEVAPQTATRHLQGYLEFRRSYRLNICQQVLPRARWARAIADAKTNYNYCIKSGVFESTGDWAVGGVVAAVGGDRPASVPLILAGLLNPMTAQQTKVSPEYSNQFNFFDRISNNIKKVKKNYEAFQTWKTYKLFNWQHLVRINMIVMCKNIVKSICI